MVGAGRPAPKTAAVSTASRIPGNANRMSITVPRTESTQPPRHAASTEITVPSAIDMTTTSAGPSIDVRAPTISRESRSRPWLSNPSR